VTSVRYKVVYDLYYVHNQGLLFDLRLLGATLLKALGVGPRLIRWACLLPSRQTVAAVFQNNMTGPDEPDPVTALQPA